MRNRPLFLLMALYTAAASQAQNLGEIRGRIFDDDGQPMPYVSVSTTVSGQPLSTSSDPDGRFVLKPLPPGLYGVTCFSMGMKKVQIPGVEVTADRATYLKDILLEASSNMMDTLVVVAYKRKLIDRDDPSRMSLLAEEFQKDPNIRDPVQFIGKNFAGVTPSPNGEGLYFRGSRTENMVSFIDGVKVSGSVPRVPPSAISSVSVYTGGLPARYGDVTGGVIVIETKTYAEMYQQRQAMEAREGLPARYID